MQRNISYLNQVDAQNLDKDLMKSPGFSIDQLMELAGLSCAVSLAKEYSSDKFGRVLIICGPGNNGGDGLVAARHLRHFGYYPSIYYLNHSIKGDAERLFSNLVKQNKDMGIRFVDDFPSIDDISNNFDIIMDAIFGFSFHGSPRSPYDSIISTINRSSCPIVCIDIPSGWDVEKGNINGYGIEKPDMLISLTAPKLCSKQFCGRFHYLGGRFLPPSLAEKYSIVIPTYPSYEQSVKLYYFCLTKTKRTISTEKNLLHGDLDLDGSINLDGGDALDNIHRATQLVI